MCGILGFSGENPSEETKLRWLFVENQDRGGHSTGIYTKKLNKKQASFDKIEMNDDGDDDVSEWDNTLLDGLDDL